MKQAARGSWSMHRHGLAALSAALVLGLLAGPAVAAAPALTITHPWIRFLTPRIPAAGYFTLYNGSSQPAELTGAASPGCGQLMLHQSIISGGTAQMKMVMSILVPAHGSVVFNPGGYHLMCMQPSEDVRPGKSIPVSLKFQDGETVSATFPVYGAKGK